MNAIALTVDVESDWGGRAESASAVTQCSSQLLELLERTDSTATFFVSTGILEGIRSELREISSCGHELAAHGDRHNIMYDMISKEELATEAAVSKAKLEDVTGKRVKGFRTPQFRKHEETEAVLAGNGYSYDSSSVMTSLTGRYRYLQNVTGSIVSFPVASIWPGVPAGLKWINFAGGLWGLRGDGLHVIYMHLFDLLPFAKMRKSRPRGVPASVTAFYAARIRSMWSTLERILMRRSSIALESCLKDE